MNLSVESGSRGTRIPPDYLVRVLMSLDEAEILTSQRGRNGGYCVQRDIDKLTVYDVIAAVSALPRINRQMSAQMQNVSIFVRYTNV